MRKYNDWERGLALGAFCGSFIGPVFMTILLAIILSYDIYGERAKFLISRGLDKYFQLPAGVSERLLSSISSSDGPESQEPVPLTSNSETSSGKTPQARPSISRRPRINRVLGAFAPSGE